MSKAMKNWVVWMAYRSRRGQLPPDAVVRGRTLWMPEFMMLKGKWRAWEYARTAAYAVWPLITRTASQRQRIVVLPQGRKPRRDVIRLVGGILG